MDGELCQATLDEYFEDLKEKSECPETIPDRPFEASDLEKLLPEETAKRREEFDDIKGDLKKQWEEEHGRPWPKYEHDVYSANGKLIRKAGSDSGSSYGSKAADALLLHMGPNVTLP